MMLQTLKALVQKKLPEVVTREWDIWTHEVLITSPKSLEDRPIIVIRFQNKKGNYFIVEFPLEGAVV